MLIVNFAMHQLEGNDTEQEPNVIQFFSLDTPWTLCDLSYTLKFYTLATSAQVWHMYDELRSMSQLTDWANWWPHRI